MFGFLGEFCNPFQRLMPSPINVRYTLEINGFLYNPYFPLDLLAPFRN